MGCVPANVRQPVPPSLRAARVLTAEEGLNGFTIEQLCEDVGVSRRTFFNYFPSKEDAIIGHLLDEFPADAIAEFLAGGARRCRARPQRGEHHAADATCTSSPAPWSTQLDFTREHIHAAHRGHEEGTAAHDENDGQRARPASGNLPTSSPSANSLDPADPVAGMAAALFGTCSHRASQVFFSEENTAGYPELLAQNLRTAQQLFSFSHLTFEGTP